MKLCTKSANIITENNIVIAIYPGSFDPITLGHLDLIRRSSRLFERVIVAVLRNPNKRPLFTVEQRLEQIRLSTKHLPNVGVDSFDGLAVEYAQMQQAQVLLRGLRAVSDFEIELQMAHTNKTLSTQIETVFLATSNEYSFLSSSVVKEIARFGGSVDHLVPPHIALDIYQCYNQKSLAESKRNEHNSTLRESVNDIPHIGNSVPAAALEVDIQEELNRLEDIVLSSMRIPLTGRTLIDEDKLLEQLDFIRLSLPAVFQEAIIIFWHKKMKFSWKQRNMVNRLSM